MNARAFVVTLEVNPGEEEMVLGDIQDILERNGLVVVDVNMWDSPGQSVDPLVQAISQMG